MSKLTITQALEQLEELARQDKKLEQTKILDNAIDKSFEAGRKSMIPLLRAAFDAGVSNISGDGWPNSYYEEPDEAFNQFLKENNIEL